MGPQISQVGPQQRGAYCEPIFKCGDEVFWENIEFFSRNRVT